ncbi:hypothetical protein NL676_023267 [Syzygium grande]|nr:hypothetical protein NL676_023267 [Syzygium grande]
MAARARNLAGGRARLLLRCQTRETIPLPRSFSVQMVVLYDRGRRGPRLKTLSYGEISRAKNGGVEGGLGRLPENQARGGEGRTAAKWRRD